VLPKYAAASPINIPDVAQTDANIHAGVKMLRNIADTYFSRDRAKVSNINAGCPDPAFCSPTEVVRTAHPPESEIGDSELTMVHFRGPEDFLPRFTIACPTSGRKSFTTQNPILLDIVIAKLHSISCRMLAGRLPKT